MLPTVTGTGSVYPPWAIEVRRVEGAFRWHQFYQSCSGCSIFVLVLKETRLRTNKNYNIVQDSTNSTYDIFIL